MRHTQRLVIIGGILGLLLATLAVVIAGNFSSDKSQAAQVLGTQIEGEPETTWSEPPNTSVPLVTTTDARSTSTTQYTASARILTTLKPKSTTSNPLPIRTQPSPKPALTFLELAQGEVGKRGTYADPGFWCALYVSWVAEQAKVPDWQSNDSPAKLYGIAQRAGRETPQPEAGGLVFIDLGGPGGPGNGQVSHVAIAESVDGDTIHTIGRAAQGGPDVVTRETWTIGDGYVVAFARVQ